MEGQPAIGEEKLYGAIGEENRPDFCTKRLQRSRFLCNTAAIWEEEWIQLVKHIYRAKLSNFGVVEGYLKY
ncbi:Hypothetical predicted protein [Olea europaea subsp. europaea]|uniref:Uncharacterized protein n=1 Tax=Olea europaea subsp. europaea TaxID=158383 RepID=A0A8S0TRT3_OLEEU|nr:Hypothetical predicted protein [Olea europaea subsp. europaea]